MVGRSWAGKTDRPKGWETLREIYTGVVAPSLPTPDDRTTTTEFQRFVLSGPVSVFTQQQQGQKGRGGNEACTYHHGRFNPAPSLIYRLASNQNLYISYHDRDLSTLIDRYTLERPVSHFHELRNVDANPVVFRLSRRLAYIGKRGTERKRTSLVLYFYGGEYREKEKQRERERERDLPSL